MAIQLQTFLQAAHARYGLRLLAGRGGLAHEFTWACLLEDIGNAGFLRGGELVITTGLAALQEHWLRDFVHALEGRQAAALILNTGKYLRESDITDEVRAFCEAHSFPLLLMPWQTHIADLMQEVCALLMEQAQKERRTEQLLCALLDDTAAPKPPAGETVLPLYPGADGQPVLLTGRQLAALDELGDSVPSGFSVEDVYACTRLAEEIDRFLERLGADERRIFMSRYWLLCPVADIAARSGFTEAKVKTSLHRTRQKLKKHLEKPW